MFRALQVWGFGVLGLQGLGFGQFSGFRVQGFGFSGLVGLWGLGFQGLGFEACRWA